MGGGVSKPSGPPAEGDYNTHPTPAPPHPLSSVEVQERATTTTVTTAPAQQQTATAAPNPTNCAAAAAAAVAAGGDDMTPRPPSEEATARRESSGDSASITNPRQLIHHHREKQQRQQQVQHQQEKPLEDQPAGGEKCRKSTSPENANSIDNTKESSPVPAVPNSAAATTTMAFRPSPKRDDGEDNNSEADTTAVVEVGDAEVEKKSAAATVTTSTKVLPPQPESDPVIAYRSMVRSVSPALALADYSSIPLSALQSELRENHRVLRVCLTGGPCAGKSTMLAEIQAKIPQRTGYQVYCVPEAATLLVTGGMAWDGSIALEQQLCLLRTQLALEDQFYTLAVASGKPTIVMSDRGTMDGRAFCSPEDFNEILRRLGCTLDVLRDRYDAVIHMVTAACGAESFYNLDNPARYEDLDGARASDEKLRQMYVGHPLFRLLDNSTSFKGKIERGLQLVSHLVGLDGAAMQKTNYFLVSRCPRELPVPCATYWVRTTVLDNSQIDEMRLLQQRIMADGSRMHFFKSVRKGRHSSLEAGTSLSWPPTSGDAHSAFTRAVHSSSGTSMGTAGSSSTQHPAASTATATTATHHHNLLGQEPTRHVANAVRISSKEYASLLNNYDPHREVVEAESTHFIFNGANFEITTILSPAWAAGKQTLTAEYADNSSSSAGGSGSEADEGEDGDSRPEFPDFINVDREVPLDSTTTAFLISHKETGPLYTSLAFAPVFKTYRNVCAFGPHADAQNILHSTHSTPNRHRSVSALQRKQASPLVELAPIPMDIAQLDRSVDAEEEGQPHPQQEPTRIAMGMDSATEFESGEEGDEKDVDVDVDAEVGRLTASAQSPPSSSLLVPLTAGGEAMPKLVDNSAAAAAGSNNDPSQKKHDGRSMLGKRDENLLPPIKSTAAKKAALASRKKQHTVTQKSNRMTGGDASAPTRLDPSSTPIGNLVFDSSGHE